MIRKLLRSCVAAGCRGSGMLARAQDEAADKLLILCYHRILPSAAKASYFAPDLVVTPESFRQHCRVLRRYFEVLPLSSAIEQWPRRASGERPLAVITFDDGYQDNHRYAAPILAEADLAATFFVVGGLVGRGQRPWYDRLAAALDEPRPRSCVLNWLAGQSLPVPSVCFEDVRRLARHVVVLAKDWEPARRRELLAELESIAPTAEVPQNDCIMTVDQLQSLRSAGHEIGSHSRTHEMLPQLDDAALEEEIAGSRAQLEEMLAAPIRSFCYPNGAMDERVVHCARRAGYTQAVTTEPGRNERQQDLHRLKRWFIHEDRLAGPGGAASGTLLRMEILGISERMFARERRRPAYA